jgi:hypothetical protein
MFTSVLIWAAIAAIVLIVCTRLYAAWRTARDIDAALDLNASGVEPLGAERLRDGT